MSVTIRLRVLLLAATAVAAGFVPANADEVAMAIKAQSEPAQSSLTVTSSNGRAAAVSAGTVPVTIALAAEMGTDGENRKIVGSELRLKTGGASSVAAANEGSSPKQSLRLDGSYDLPVEPTSRLAADAVVACQKSGADTAVLSVPVIWRVTTGKFNFRWTDYDLIAPSKEFHDNPDFYSDRKVFEQETVAQAEVRCVDAGSSKAADKSESTLAPKGNKLALANIETPTSVASDSSPIDATELELKPAQEVVAAPTASTTVAVIAKPVCDGGIVRQIQASPASYLCLCPGNTARVSSGDNAFSCARKFKRR